MSRLVRGLGRCVAAVFALLSAYALAALAGTFIVTAGESVPPSGEGVDVYILSNGYHTDIAVPSVEGPHDWRPLLDGPEFPPAAAAAARYIAFGWGSRAAYPQVGTLADLSPSVMFQALAFDRSVMHAVPLRAISEAPQVRRVRLTEQGYSALTEVIRASFARDGAGRFVALRGATQGFGDAFFEARGRFSFLRGCNVWTGEALRAAGVRMGVWTPFAQSVFWSLP